MNEPLEDYTIDTSGLLNPTQETLRKPEVIRRAIRGAGLTWGWSENMQALSTRSGGIWAHKPLSKGKRRKDDAA